MEWQPIETAPKSPAGYLQSEFLEGPCGPEIILLVDYSEGSGESNFSVSCGVWDATRKCWRYFDDDGPNDVQPTHWMPLPEPPNAQAQPRFCRTEENSK